MISDNTATHSETNSVGNVWHSMLSEIRSVAKASKIYGNAKIEEVKLKAKLGSIAFFTACALVMGGISYLLAGTLILFSLELPNSATKTIAYGITFFGGLVTVAGIVALIGIRNWSKNLHGLQLKEKKALKVSKRLIGKLGEESKLLLSPKYWFKKYPLAIIGSGIAIGFLTRKPLAKGANSGIKAGEKYLVDLAVTALTAAFVNQIKKELRSDQEETTKESQPLIH